MITLTNEQVKNLTADQDKAASGFWSYPDMEWQIEFQRQWLNKQFGETIATDKDGLMWGECP